MIGAALSRRSGRLKLGLRLGKPALSATLDNTLGTSTIAGTSVQNYGPGYADQLRAAAASAGYTFTTLDSASVASFVNENEAALASLEAPAPVQHYSAAGGGAVTEGNPSSVQHYAAAGGGAVSEGN